MKTLSLVSILGLFVMFVAPSCDQIDEFTKFDLSYTTSVTVPATPLLSLPIDLLSPTVEVEEEDGFAANETTKDLIEEVTLKSMVLKVTSPSDQRLDFLESIEVYISADSLSDLLIASASDIPEDVGDELVLETTENDLSEYIKKDAFQIRVKATTDGAVSSDTEIDVTSVFEVDAKVLGI